MKTKILFLPLIAIVLFAVSCAKTKVITKKTVDVSVLSTDWLPYGTSGTFEYHLRFSVTVPEITQSVMDNGMVLAYLNTSSFGISDPSGGYALMPYVQSNVGYSRTFSAAIYLGSVTFTLKDSDLAARTIFNDTDFRLIVCDEVEKNLLINTDLNNYQEVLYTLENAEK